MKTITFFSVKGGVGKTTLIYHLAWMYAELGLSVLAVDLDPQSGLSSMFLDDERLGMLWPNNKRHKTIYGAVQPMLDGIGKMRTPHVESITDRLGLLVGDLELINVNDVLNSQWQECLTGSQKAFRAITAFSAVIEKAAVQRDAVLVLLDLAPNLSVMNKAVLLGTQYAGIPLTPSFYSELTMKALGSALRTLRNEWKQRLLNNRLSTHSTLPITLRLIGYVLLQHQMQPSHSVRDKENWMTLIPWLYRRELLDDADSYVPYITNDENNLAILKSYHGLMSLARDVHKPMFLLQAADGAVGSHATAVQNCYRDYRALARRIAKRCEVELP